MDLRISCCLIFMFVVFVYSYNYVTTTEMWKVCIVDSVRKTNRIHSLCPNLLGPIECVVETDSWNNRTSFFRESHISLSKDNNDYFQRSSGWKTARHFQQCTTKIYTDIVKFGCIRRIIDGDADFTILEPEELLAIRDADKYNVLVTNELRLFQNEAQRFEVVAIGHKNLHHTFDLKDKRLCHPGFETVGDWTKSFSMYFEDRIISKECNPELSLLENRLHALSNYFEMACIAGPWSSDHTFDLQLKLKYKNLCAACENPASCYNTDKYYGRQGAILCLTDEVGDVAWARLDDARVHFKTENIDARKYKFLCSDGVTKPLDFSNPCVWISKPWPIIVARSSSAEKIASLLQIQNTTTWEPRLLQLLENYYVSPINVEDLRTPVDYLGQFPNFLSANTRSDCQPSREVKWCLTSDIEKHKCEALKAAATAYGVVPHIICLQSENTSCLEEVRSERMDIFAAQPDEFLDAKKKGLKPIAHMMTNTRQGLSRIVAITKLDTRFTRLLDLTNLRASFTGYRSVGWNAFTTLMGNLSHSLDDGWDCLDAQAVANFFRNSCVLGLNDADRKLLPANLYSLCRDTKETGDDLTAFSYLTSELVDVAFVDLNVIESHIQPGDFFHQKIDHKNLNRKPKYRVLGPSFKETVKIAPYILAWTTLGSIVVNENITKLRQKDIYSMLIEMDKLFGRNFNGDTPAFSLYGPYDNNSGVIFPNGTRYLEAHGRQVIAARSYDEILEDILKHQTCNAANIRMLRFPLVLCIVFVFRLFSC